MVCGRCKQAGHALQRNQPIAARKLHELCKGSSWCDCQHKTQPLLPEPKGGHPDAAQ